MRRKLTFLAAAAMVATALGPAATISSAKKPPPHCDPMACPDPVGDATESAECIALYDSSDITALPTHCLPR